MPPLRRLLHYLSPYAARIVVASGNAVLNTVFDLFPDFLVGVALDTLVHHEQSWLGQWGFSNVSTQLLVVGGVGAVVWVFAAVTEYLYIYLWRSLGQTVQHVLRVATYDHVQKLSLSYYQERGTGSLISVLNDDIAQLERFFDYGAYKCIYLITTITLVGSTFLYCSPLIALCVLGPLVLTILTVFYFKKKVARCYVSIRSCADRLSNRIANSIMGIFVVKSYTNEHHELACVARESVSYRNANREAIQLNAAFYATLRLVVIIGFIGTMVIGGFQVIQGTLQLGVYSVLIFQVQKILWPSSELAELVDLYGRARASLKRVFALLDLPIEEQSRHHSIVKNAVLGKIELRSVSFSYQHGPRILTDFSCVIEPGSSVAFVGATGSGKSTLVKLLVQMYMPDCGALYLDDQDMRFIELAQLRQAVGVVSQEVFLFPGTIYDNIIYGSSNASHEQVIHAAQVAQIHDFIATLPHGYDTIVGERGASLSGGQRQRISLARLIVRSPAVFVFDEATAAVDYETEAAIQKALNYLHGFHTVIMISHRFSLISGADKIFVLDKGAVAQSGTHQELMTTVGLYRSLWHAQTGLVDQ